MRYVIGLPIVVFVAFLAYGAITGRAKAKSCCSIDPANDIRMRED